MAEPLSPRQTPYEWARQVQPMADHQLANRGWWELLPMTYKEWSADDRTTSREAVVRDFLDANPWLRPDYFRQFTGKSVLDIGSGAGPASVLYAEGGAEVTAIDITHRGVALTEKHTAGLGVTALRMDAEEMTFPDASFDQAFSWGVLHHSANPERAFAEVARVLKPGGTALIMVYNRASLRYWIKGAIWLLLKGKLLSGESFRTVQRFYTDGYFQRHFTPGELARALAPLRIERMSVTHMSGRMLPLIPRALDEWCKRRWGWLLVAEVRR